MGNLFQELKRRNVYKVATLYVVSGWVLLQVVSTVFPAFGFSDEGFRTLTLFLLAGFPVALILSWLFEVSSGKIRRTKSNSEPSSTAPFTSDLIVIFLLLAVVGIDLSERIQFPTTPENSLNTKRFNINLGETTIRGRGNGMHADIAASPDGTKLVYKVQRPDTDTLPELWLRELDQFQSRLLTTGTISKPFFSPDGDWVAYIDSENTELHKISIVSGSTQLLAREINGLTGGFWHTDGFIYLSDNAEPSGLLRVSEDGNERESITAKSGIQDFHVWPHPLPDNESLLFSLARSVQLLNLQTGRVRTLIDNGGHARYVPSGHIVFRRNSDLWAVPFDLESYEIAGREVLVIQNVETNRVGKAGFTFAGDGTLFYVPAQEESIEDFGAFVWVDRDGKEELISTEVRPNSQPVISPDGQRLALANDVDRQQDIWIYDLARNTLVRLNFDDSREMNPLWSTDGTRVAYYSSRDGGSLWWRAANGIGEAELLISASGGVLRPNSFTPDGMQLAYEFDGDLFLLTLGSNEPAEPLIGTDFVEARASISPDGRWIAYESDESGEFNIYVSPFPEVEGGKWQVSTTGGIWPKWSREGDSLFYREVAGAYSNVWEAKLNAGGSGTEFQFETPTQLFEGSYPREPERNFGSAFDVSSADSRFLLLKEAEISLNLTDSENT